MINHPNRKTKKTAVETVATAPVEDAITCIKGFDQNWQCQGYQYEIGKTYDHPGKVVACPSTEQVGRGEGGFHAISGHPLEVLGYYPPATSRYAIVTQSGELARHSEDSKIASARITIEAEIQLPELIQRAVKWVFDRAKWSEGAFAAGPNEGATASGDSGAATASGDSGAATASGDSGAATASGDRGAATASGVRGAATASGDSGAATASGDSGAATASGYSGAATASGDRGAATASGDRGAATASGDRGAATASGYSGAATASGYSGAATASGYSGAATASGDRGAATASGDRGRVRGADGCALFLTYRDQNTYNILHAWAGIAGRDGIEVMVWYQLGADGKPVKCE